MTALFDRGRSEVYACELAAFDGTDLEAVRSFEAISGSVAGVVEHPWWPGPAVHVVAARPDARSLATHGPVDGSGAVGSAVTIRLAGGQLTTATAAHELGHALAGVAHGHDAVFRRAYLDVVEVITNLDPTDRRGRVHVGQLLDAFTAAGLSVGPRWWPAPGPSVGGAVAVCERTGPLMQVSGVHAADSGTRTQRRSRGCRQ